MKKKRKNQSRGSRRRKRRQSENGGRNGWSNCTKGNDALQLERGEKVFAWRRVRGKKIVRAGRRKEGKAIRPTARGMKEEGAS